MGQVTALDSINAANKRGHAPQKVPCPTTPGSLAQASRVTVYLEPNIVNGFHQTQMVSHLQVMFKTHENNKG